jgi:hypothetical protein
MAKRLILPLLAFAAVATPTAWAATDRQPATSAHAADTVRSCPGNRPLGNTGVWYGDLSVRNMSCRRGRRVLRRARLRNGRILVSGWRCRLIGYYRDGGIFRCTRDRRAMRFSAGG